jgi:hypothetical protein
LRATGQGDAPSHSAVIARLDRAIQYAEASRFHYQRLWNTGSPAFAGDDNCA